MMKADSPQYKAMRDADLMKEQVDRHVKEIRDGQVAACVKTTRKLAPYESEKPKTVMDQKAAEDLQTLAKNAEYVAAVNAEDKSEITDSGVPAGEQRPEPPPAPPAIDGHRPDSNPKSALGIKKTPMHLVSPISILHEAMAMAEGGMKYGPYNYREDHVAATVYIAAMLRHVFAWSMGEENTPDSNLHHLAHAKACCGILLDAQANGSMIDDRFKCAAYAELIKQFDAMLPAMAERIAAMKDELEAHNR